MKTKVVLLLMAPAAVCLGTDCQRNASSMPLQVANGTYAGPVEGRTQAMMNGVQESPTIVAGYRIVHVIEGALRHVRRNLDRNGPFACEIVAPGEQRTSAPLLSGLDSGESDTITEVWPAGYRYIVTAVVSGLQLTGEGTVEVTPINGALEWLASDVVQGGGIAINRTTQGTLYYIGDIGSIPIPEGMNGTWLFYYPEENASDAVDIRGLRVVAFTDINGFQQVYSSQPVTPSIVPGSSIFVAFDANTSFLSDTALRRYSIAFRGTVAEDGIIKGITTFITAGKDPIEIATELQRTPSSTCQ